MEKRLQQYGQFFYTSPHHSTEFSDEIESSSRLFQRNAIYNSSLIASDDDEQLFFEINPPPFFWGGWNSGEWGEGEKRLDCMWILKRILCKLRNLFCVGYTYDL